MGVLHMPEFGHTALGHTTHLRLVTFTCRLPKISVKGLQRTDKSVS